ncbi:hypothetical protein DFJ73DRAFT_90463 [Zopfochytrium polystomum]|nr:hypothetical protein DFJ73DRAFT_90463 [Zopfochytrium polystomum]
MDQHLPQFQQHRSSDLHPHYPPHPPTHQLLQYQNQLQFTSHPHQPVNHQPLHSTHAQQLRSQQQQQHLQSLLQTVTSSVSDDADRPAMANNLNARSAPGVGGFPVPDYPIGVPPSVEPASVDPSWHAVLTDGGHPQQGRAPGPARRPFVSHADQRQQWSIATPQQTPTATVTSPPRRSLFPPSFYAENPPPFLQGPKPASLPNSGSHVVSTHGYPSSSTSSSWRENETVPYTQDRSSRSSPLPPQRRSGSFRSGRSSADPSLTAVSVPSPSSPATSQHLLHPFASPAQLGSAKIRSERSPSQQSFATSQHNWHRETPPLSVSHSAPASPALRAQPEQHSVPPPKILLSKGVHILHPLVIQKLLSSIEELSMGVMESLSLLKHSLLPSDNGIRSATPTDRLFAVPSDHQIEISHASDLAALSMSNAVSFLLAASFILHSAGTQQQVGHLKTYFESVKLDIAAAAKTGALQGSTFIREQLANRVGQADQLSIQLWAFVVIELENSLELSSAVLDSAALPTDTEAIRSMARTLCQFILSKSKLPKDASLDSFLSVTSDILFYCDKFFKGYDRLGHIIPRVLELDAGSASGADLFEFAGSEAVARALDLSIVISNETKVAGKKKPEQLSSQSRDQAVRQWTDTLLTLSYIVEDTAATISLMEEQDRKIGTRQSSLRSSSPSLSGSLTSATPSTSSQSADDGLGAETFAFAVRSPSPVDPAGKSQRPRIMWQGANSRHIHSADPSRAGRFTLERPPRDSSSDRHRDGASSPGLPPLRRRGSVDSVLKERADLSSAGTGSSHHSGPLSLVDSIVPPDLLAAWKRALRLMSSRARGTSLSPQLAASVKTDSSVQPLSFKYRPALRVRTRNFAKALNATFLAFVSDVSSGKLGTAGGSDYNFTLSVSTFGSLDLPPSVSPDPAGTSSVLERLMIVGSALLETVESLVADGCDIIKESEKSERSLSGGGKSKSEDLRSQLEAATGAVVAALAALWERRPSTRPLDSLGSGQHSRFPAAEVLQDQISRNVRRLPANIQLMVLLCFQSLTSVESLHFALDDFLASVDLALLEIERRSAASPASTSPAAVEGHDGHAVSAGVGVLGELGFAAEKGALAASEVSPASEKPPTSQTPTETTATAEAMSSHFPAKIPDYLLPYILEDNYVGLVFEGLKKDAPLQKRVSMDPAASDGRFVRSGTMAMLVVRMTHYCTRDPSFTHSFLQSFSSFTTLNILLTHIIMRLESTLSLPEDLPPNFVHSYIAYVRIPVRIAALRLIAMLLELYMPPSHRSDMAGYRDKIDEALRYKDVHVTLFNGGDADDELKKGAERLKDVAAHIEKLWGRLTVRKFLFRSLWTK